jgi:hypothetical protein
MEILAAPAVRTMAKKDGTDLSQIKGTGKNGTILKADYDAFMGRETVAPVISEARSPMNHLTDEEVEIGGMKFSRAARTSMDYSMKTTLTLPEKYKNKDLEYRWVHDLNGRIDRLLEAGYKVVDPKTLSKDEEISVRRRVGSKKDGSDLHAVLMATPKKWYQDRHAQVENERKSKESALMRNPQDDSGQLGKEFYIKKESNVSVR